MSRLFETNNFGAVNAQNRVFMAPLTRNRADNATDVPAGISAEYYKQRASAGLIITEATQISPEGKGYVGTPGIYSKAQVESWREIVNGVHSEGTKIFIQLWHVGRISHTSLQPNGQRPVAPSAIQANAQTFSEEGPVDVSKPRELTLSEIDATIEDYRKAAEHAKDAGFDGVEVHAANGYLIDQFLRDKTNLRRDEYGGSSQNRARFLFRVLDQVVDVFGSDRVGIRLSPTGSFNDIADSDPLSTFGYVIDKLNDYGLAYLHMVERFPGILSTSDELETLLALRSKWQGFYVANGDYDRARGEAAVESGHGDAIAFGRPFIANPDLPERLRIGAPLNEPDPTTFYGGGAHGYIDYPALTDEVVG